MGNTKLILEILSGPLDGHILALEDETAWGRSGEGPLIFPWDTELSSCQGRFFPEEGNWWIESCSGDHGTYCINRQERVDGRLQLKADDLLSSCSTFLLVREIREVCS